MNFNDLVNKILNESKPFKVSLKVSNLAADITTDIYDHSDIIEKWYDIISENEYSGEKSSNYYDKSILLMQKQYNDPIKRGFPLHVDVLLHLGKGSENKALGVANLFKNKITINISLYSDIDYSYMHHAILHELVHLYDPHLLMSHSMLYIDKGLGIDGVYDSNTEERYYTGTGYRAGKIPLEFNPKIAEIIQAHSKAEIAKFLKTLDINLLHDYVKNFVETILKNKYLKRKLIEKLYHYAYVEGNPFKDRIKHGEVYAFYNGEFTDSITTPEIKPIWYDSDKESTYAELDMVATYREFYTYEDFVKAVKSYVSKYGDEKYRDIVDVNKRAFKWFDYYMGILNDAFNKYPGVYKLIAQEDHGELLFGKEIY